MWKQISLIFFSVLTLQCSDYTPKPIAYPRIIFPIKAYEKTSHECPFEFEKPIYSQLINDPYNPQEFCWKNLVFPQFKATLHLTYRSYKTQKELDQLIEDTYTMAFKHIQKAEEISEREVTDSIKNISGMIYDLQGKTATPYNFYLANKNGQFVRGSFYFNEKTIADSVAPIYEFINSDLLHLVQSFKFK